MDPNGHIYYDPDGIPKEDTKRLEEALSKADNAERDRLQAHMDEAREAYEALRDA